MRARDLTVAEEEVEPEQNITSTSGQRKDNADFFITCHYCGKSEFTFDIKLT
jgi:hypothetical protein